ncbi:MAG: TraB/GumN family protein [Pseudomonadota bacterium]
MLMKASGQRVQTGAMGFSHVIFIILLMIISGTSPFSTPVVAHAANQSSIGQDGDIVVVGERNGPRLWRILNDDAEVFVLVGVSFLPDDLKWNDRVLVQILDETKEVLVSPDADVGAGNRARLLGTMIRTLIFNRSRIMMPKGTSLDDKVGPELASQFRLARARVDARLANKKERDKQKSDQPAAQDEAADDAEPLVSEVDAKAIEKRLEKLEPGRMHPFFQGQNLMSDAIESAGLGSFDRLEKQIKKRARKSAMRPKPKIRPVTTFDVAFRDVKTIVKSVKDFSRETNQACLRSAIDFANDGLIEEAQRARAWARGDVAFLRESADAPESSPCAEALSKELGSLKTLGDQSLTDFDSVDIWVSALRDVMQSPGVRVALIPVDDWLRPDGALERLRAEGFVIVGP